MINNIFGYILIFSLGRLVHHLVISIIQAWEPRAAKVTKSYFRCLPALERFYRETKSVGLKFPNHNFRKIGAGVPDLDKQTDRQTEITTLHI